MARYLEIFLSNRLEILYQRLKSSLFGFTKKPLPLRLVVVYGPAMKNWLMLRMAQDPDLNIATGIEFIYLNQAFERLLKLTSQENIHLPTLLELALAIEKELINVLLNFENLSPAERCDWKPLLHYLKLDTHGLKRQAGLSRKAEKRLVSLSQSLARIFQDYGRYAGHMVAKWESSPCEGWQPYLWRQLFGKNRWSYFTRLLQGNIVPSIPFTLHFFSISFITPAEFFFLNRLSESVSVNYYLLSPCAVFWSDIRSERENAYLQTFLQKKFGSLNPKVLKLEELLRDCNPLLANFGRLGREMASQIEESQAQTDAYYLLPQHVLALNEELFIQEDLYFEDHLEPLSLLHAIQADLLMMRNPQGLSPFNLEYDDQSLQLHIAPNLRRETEILYYNLLGLIKKNPSLCPEDMIVMAPQIGDYVPYIQRIFGMESSQLDFQILDLGMQTESEIVQGFLQLLELSESRWDASQLLQLFEHPSFQRRHQMMPSDIVNIREWIKQAAIRWGDDYVHRNEFLQRRHCRRGMADETAVGTWDYGLSQFLLGLTMGGDFPPNRSFDVLPHSTIDFSQSELLEKWILLLHSLRDDLSVLQDDTRMTMEDWANYLGCLLQSYFQPNADDHHSLEEYNDLKAQFEILKNSAQFFKEAAFPFISVKTHLLSLLHHRGMTYREAHLQAVRFCSLMPLRSIPAKVVAIIGLQEGAFPRINQLSSLNLMVGQEENIYFPTSTDHDRYLFLEALHSARDYLLISYQGYNQEDSKEVQPSLVVKELFSYLEQFYKIQGQKVSQKCIFKHPFDSFDKRYFKKGEKLYNFSHHDYHMAQILEKKNHPPYHFLKEFTIIHDSQILQLPNQIDLKHLSAVAANPIKFHLNKVLEIYLQTEEDRLIKIEEEFILSSLEKYRLKQLALKEPLETVLYRAEREGNFPLGLFKTIAAKELREDIQKIHESLQRHSLDPSQIFQIEFSIGCSEPTQLKEDRWLFPAVALDDKEGRQLFISGKLSHVTSKGLLNLKKNAWEMWPQFLLYSHASKLCPQFLQPHLIFTQSGQIKKAFFDDPKPHLKNFVNYYTLCLQQFSPLLPDWIPFILKGDVQGLQNKIDNLFKEFFTDYKTGELRWILNRHHLPCSEFIIQNWKSQAELLLGDMMQNWYPPKKLRKTMKQFNVLDRSLNIHRNYLLEASAGTGKTFSIQNIVVRLLIESNGQESPFSLQKILIVTFTRAATRDLKNRIHSNIEQALLVLKNHLHKDHVVEQIPIPDYLKACGEKGEEAIQQACKKLQQALFTFDQAQIFTIHSFCFRMLHQFALESDMGMHVFSGEDSLPQSEMMGLIRDFLRTEVRKEQYSPAQLEILLKKDPDQKELLKLIQKGYDFPLFRSFDEIFMLFNESMKTLKRNLALESEKMIEDFQAQASSYKNDKSGNTKAAALAKVIRFAKLFDQEAWCHEDLDRLIADRLVWVDALNSSLLKEGKAVAPQELHYPELTKQLEATLYPLIQEAADEAVLMARMARDCQQLLRRYQQEEEKLAPDDLLRKMNIALDQTSFLTQIQANYQAVIIDEFQDTDPQQWQIFRRLFIPEQQFPLDHWKGFLYLVGDPKQSIYSFRQADIYTYLAAAQVLGESHCFSLNVNYRSQPCLVHALNALFVQENMPCFIPLPKKLTFLPYHPVQPSEGASIPSFEDDRGAIHFFIADGRAFKKPKLSDLETHIFFPFIAREMTQLKREKGFTFRQFAILVSDRLQALRIASFFDHHRIPYLNQKGVSLADSPALQSFIDLMRAVLNPQNRGAFLTALGSPIMGWTHEELKHLESEELNLLLIQRLRGCLFDKGFPPFFQELLQATVKPNGRKVQEEILSREDGLEFYRDLQQIADIIVDHHYQEWNGPEGIVPFLDRFRIWEENHEERLKRFQDPETDGVKILTLHYSKGLEFDIVFALGLVSRKEIKEELIPIESRGELLLTPISEESVERHRYCEENDAEKMRQLYVAFTRAKSRLYVPVALHLPSAKLKLGEASPMDLFLARLKQPAASHQTLYEKIQFYEGTNLFDFLETSGKEHFMTSTLHQEVLYESSHKNEEYLLDCLQPPPFVTVASQPLFISSFSALSKKSGPHDLEHFAFFTTPQEGDIKDVHTMPSNHEIGLLIHYILEKINFQDFKNLKHPNDAISLVSPFVKKSSFVEWECVIGHLIFNTLRTPLKQIGENFCLADLKLSQIYREMPFIFPYKERDGIEDIHFYEGLIKGVVDLLFYHEGFYYLVDWKTNRLGHEMSSYEYPFLQMAMQENAYFLQAAIYTEAIKRYLRLVDSRPFEECFGGVFYLFLRGMVLGKDNGIYRLTQVTHWT